MNLTRTSALVTALLLCTNARAATFTVTNNAGIGPGSLNQAIIDANAGGGLDTIEFAIPPFDSTVKTILQTNNLTNVTGPTIIDGFTQPGSSSNTLATGNNAVLLIQLSSSSPGLTFQGGGCTVRGLILNRFSGGGNGLFFQTAASNNVIEGCFIGTDATGMTNSVPQLTDGVSMQSGGNLVGGTNPWQRNVIGGCTSSGVFINSGTNNVVGNYIGTDKNGTGKIANANGVSVNSGSSNLVGGATMAARNLISGNSLVGINLGGSGLNTVQGNFIGTDVTGLQSLGNLTGVSVASPSNHVGGAAATLGAPPGNVISGNTGQGVSLGGGSGHLVAGNLIGTDATGTADLGNASDGIRLNTPDTVVSNNVVSGNNAPGIQTTGGAGSRNKIVANLIGTDITGMLNVSNNSFGVNISAGSDDEITGNIIAFNGDHGVNIVGSTATNNMVCFNSIHSNARLGINLFTSGQSGTHVTSNDVCDVDFFVANHLQNYPVLTNADSDANSVTIAGLLDSVPNKTYLLEFFANNVCDTSGHGEGEFFIGATNLVAGADCTNFFSYSFPVSVPGGMFVTSTATDPDGNTSEFSACRTNVSTIVTAECSLEPQLSTNMVDTIHTVTTTVTTNGLPVAGLDVSFSVSGAHTIAATNVTTDVNGQAMFSYLGTNVGTDGILAAGGIGFSEFACGATKVWLSANVPPTISCPNNIVTNNAPDQCSRSVAFSTPATGTPTPTVTCQTNSTLVTSPLTVLVGTTTTVSCTASNSAGSMTCFFDVTVNDTQSPSIGCPAGVITNVLEGETGAVVSYGAPTATDNCPGLSTNCAPASGSLFQLGMNTVTCTATDNSGNTATCTFTVTVNTTATNNNPMAVCQDVVASANTNCVAIVAASAVNNGSSDPDGDPITLSLNPPGPFALGMTGVTLTVADNRGGTNTCNAIITVNDTTPPGINCPGTITTNVPSGTTSAVVNFTTPTPTDNCPGPNALCAPVTGSSFPVGTTPVTCTATDSSGNTAQCTFNVTVNELPPEPHDFAIINLKAPKTINLKAADPALTKKVKVQIQNRSPHDETIPDLATLANLVTVQIESLGKCPAPVAVLIQGSPNNVPKTIKSKGKLNVQFDVTYTCANDPEKGTGHEDYSYTAHVNHAALGTGADTHIADDNCPRQPLPGEVDPNPDPDKPLKDKGCGGKTAAGTLGAPVLTDVVIK